MAAVGPTLEELWQTTPTSPLSLASTLSSWLCRPRNSSTTSTATAAWLTSLMTALVFATCKHRLTETKNLVLMGDKRMDMLQDEIQARKA